MARSLCPDRPRASIATAALALLLVRPRLAQPDRRDRARRRGGAGALSRRRRTQIADDLRHAGVAALGIRLPRRRSSRCWRCPSRRSRAACSRCSPPSIAPAPWCSAAAMSCCRCCATPSWRRDGFPTTRSSPAMARLRRCRDRCSPSPPISARSPARRRPASRAPSSRSSRSSCRACWRWWARCRSGAHCAR